MFFPFERPSAGVPGCGSPDSGVSFGAADVSDPVIAFPGPRGPAHDVGAGRAAGPAYSRAEVARRVGVSVTVLRDWEDQLAGGSAGSGVFTAFDVVRYEALFRLVRRGVTVARAVQLVRSAGRPPEVLNPAASALPKAS